MDWTDPGLVGIATALGCGLLIGIERERRLAGSAPRGIAGVRTFAIAALAGALAQWLGQPLLVAAGAALVLALVAIAYLRDRGRDRGITTELALFVTYLLGVTAIVDPAVAAAGGVIVAVLLAARTRLHHFATHTLGEGELRDVLILAAAALVVLPMIPAHPIAWLAGIEPRRLWALVVLMLAMQAVGHVAIRVMGPGPGLIASGFVFGFVSSTATFASMGARARQAPAFAGLAAAGALASNLATLIQMGVVLATLHPPALVTMLPSLLGGALGAALPIGLSWVRRGSHGAGGSSGAGGSLGSDGADGAVGADGADGAVGVAGAGGAAGAAGKGGPMPARAFRLAPALGFACLLSAVTAAVSWVQAQYGEGAAVLGTALAGFADVHAASASAVSLAAGGRLAAAGLQWAILLAFTANTAGKLIAAVAAGGAGFAGRVLPGLLLLLAGVWAPMLRALAI